MTETAEQSDGDRIRHGLEKVLAAHGYGFQYAVLRRAEQIQARGKSPWRFTAAEFPVSTGTEVTHIDFILHAARNSTYLVAECKRVDPARARWCFVRAPYTWFGATGRELIFQEVVTTPPDTITARVHVQNSERGIYHIGFGLRTDAKGDGLGKTSGIDEAATQVLRGTNGLMNHLFASSAARTLASARTRFLPLIFTTAELWVSDTDLGATDVTSGQINPGEVSQVPWLWFTYNQSPDIRHRLSRPAAADDIAQAVRTEFARTVAIVGPDGIDRFLGGDLLDWLD